MRMTLAGVHSPRRWRSLCRVPHRRRKTVNRNLVWDIEADRVGVDDNSFELGGHSLVAVRLVAEMEKRLGCNVPVALLFQLPTIARLASELHLRALEQSSPVIAV
jgi:acyl carrier protein